MKYWIIKTVIFFGLTNAAFADDGEPTFIRVSHENFHKLISVGVGDCEDYVSNGIRFGRWLNYNVDMFLLRPNKPNGPFDTFGVHLRYYVSEKNASTCDNAKVIVLQQVKNIQDTVDAIIHDDMFLETVGDQTFCFRKELGGLTERWSTVTTSPIVTKRYVNCPAHQAASSL